jgi:hypothetical protein
VSATVPFVAISSAKDSALQSAAKAALAEDAAPKNEKNATVF